MDTPIYFPLDPKEKGAFFRDFTALLHLWNRDVKIEINEDALTELRNWAYRDTVENCGVENLKFKVEIKDKKTRIDIMLIPIKRSIIQVGVGAHSDKSNRKVYEPYKRKQASRKLVIYLKGEKKDLRDGN